MSFIGTDTIWAVGGQVQFPNLQHKGILYRTTNGGDNWLFQIPDTSTNFGYFSYIQFINSSIGWAYMNVTGGIHTTNGGDTTFLSGIRQISSNVPRDFKLYQNYPNPFNPGTKLKFEMSKSGYAELKVFDVSGKIIAVLVNQKLNTGIYETDFNGNNLASGVYLYSLITDNKLIDTKKMILLK